MSSIYHSVNPPVDTVVDKQGSSYLDLTFATSLLRLKLAPHILANPTGSIEWVSFTLETLSCVNIESITVKGLSTLLDIVAASAMLPRVGWEKLTPFLLMGGSRR